MNVMAEKIEQNGQTQDQGKSMGRFLIARPKLQRFLFKLSMADIPHSNELIVGISQDV